MFEEVIVGHSCDAFYVFSLFLVSEMREYYAAQKYVHHSFFIYGRENSKMKINKEILTFEYWQLQQGDSAMFS